MEKLQGKVGFDFSQDVKALLSDAKWWESGGEIKIKFEDEDKMFMCLKHFTLNQSALKCTVDFIM